MNKRRLIYLIGMVLCIVIAMVTIGLLVANRMQTRNGQEQYEEFLQSVTITEPAVTYGCIRTVCGVS